jgi:hypothetical protein
MTPHPERKILQAMDCYPRQVPRKERNKEEQWTDLDDKNNSDEVDKDDFTNIELI